MDKITELPLPLLLLLPPLLLDEEVTEAAVEPDLVLLVLLLLLLEQELETVQEDMDKMPELLLPLLLLLPPLLLDGEVMEAEVDTELVLLVLHLRLLVALLIVQLCIPLFRDCRRLLLRLEFLQQLLPWLLVVPLMLIPCLQ